MSTVAEQLVHTLHAAGVGRVFGLPGDSLNGFTDALRRDGTIDWIHVRHEEAAAFAASAEAQITGELAVCAGSCGPGNLHLINGLFDAQRSRVPVLAIAAQIPSAEIGGGYFQETHPQELFRECSVFCEMAASAEQFPRIAEMAVRAAVERQGVAVLVVPGDLLLARVPHARARSGHPPIVRASSSVVPAERDLRAAAEILERAERPAILAGAGCAGAHAELVALAEALQAPVVHTMRGKEHVAYDNPYDVGMTGLLGHTAGAHALDGCDALVLLGTDFPYRQFLPQDVPVVQVDLRGEVIGRRMPVRAPLVGGVAETVRALLPLLTLRAAPSHWLDQLRHMSNQSQARLDHAAEDGRAAGPVRPELVARRVSALATEDAVFIPDVGTPVIWAARHLDMNGRRRLIGSFTHGSMANALPQAIGVAAAAPERQVVTLSGDGGLTMLLGDLLTLRQHALPVKVVVFANGALGFVELEMKAAGVVNYGTELDNPSLAAVASAVGLWSRRVERPGDLDDALREAFAVDGPALVEVMTARHELALPPTIAPEQAKGFALWGLRTVLSGRGDELLDLARDNATGLHRP